MKPFKHLLSIGLLLVASIGVSFGAFLSNNKVNSEPEVKEAKADTAPDGYQYFYFTVTSTWNGGNTALEGDLYWDEYTDNVYTIESSDIFYASTVGLYYARCTISKSSTRVKFSNGEDFNWLFSRPKQTATLTPDAGTDLFILTSENSNSEQTGYFDTLADWSSGNSSDTLYFVPNYTWCHDEYSGGYCWPKLEITYSDETTTTYNEPDGVTDPDGCPSSKVRPCVFYYNGVALKKITYMCFTHNKDVNWLSPTCYIYFDADTRAKWYTSDGSHDANVFAMGSDGWLRNETISGVTSFYKQADSNAYVAGSFLLDSTSAWNRTVESAHTFGFNGDYYAYYGEVVQGDEFKYVVDYYLDNVSTSGNAASYQLTGDECGYSESNISVYENDLSTAATLTDYLANDSQNIKFLKCGYVSFIRKTDTTTDDEGYKLYIIFHLSHEMSSFPTIQICGGFNSWVLGSNVFTYYNNSHDSLETLVYVTNDQRFKFALLNDDSTYTYLGPDDSISFTHTDIDIGDYYEEDGSHNFWFNGDTGYYLFGACVVNTNPSGTPSRAIYYYMSALSTDTSAGTYLLAQKIQEVLTCEATSDQASELAILYGLCADYTDRDTYLLAYTFSDYSLEDYAANDYSYVGLEDMNHTTNAYAKYQWIQYIANGGDMPDPGAIRLFGNGFDYEDDMTSMVIIIASSVSLLSLTALSVLIIKKKKTTSK